MPLKPSYCALSMLFTDWNRSGTPSLRVSNDREYYEGGQEQLWHVEAGMPPSLYSEAEGWRPLKIWGMGIATTTLPGDGYPAYALTSMADQKLQILADPQGRDVAAGLQGYRLSEEARPRTGPTPAAISNPRRAGTPSSRT